MGAVSSYAENPAAKMLEILGNALSNGSISDYADGLGTEEYGGDREIANPLRMSLVVSDEICAPVELEDSG
jgi:hypothetical protein